MKAWWAFMVCLYLFFAGACICGIVYGILHWGDHWWVGIAYLGLVVTWALCIMMAVVISSFEVFHKGIR